MKHTQLIQIISAPLLFLFTYTAFNKLMDHTNFYLTLTSILHHKTACQLFSWLIPLAEMAVSVLLFASGTRYFGLILSCLLLITFTAVILYLINYSPHLPCTCGGVISSLTWSQHLWFNIIFIILSIIGIWFSKQTSFNPGYG